MRTWTQNTDMLSVLLNLNVQMARLRIGCSSLNQRLCQNLHVVDNPSCRCGHRKEDCNHYFLSCPLFVEEREILFKTLEDFEFDSHILINGSPLYTYESNLRPMGARILLSSARELIVANHSLDRAFYPGVYVIDSSRSIDRNLSYDVSKLKQRHD